MASVMHTISPIAKRAFFLSLLSNPDIVFSTECVDPDFDDPVQVNRYSGEPLDWHNCRHWPALATD